MTSLCPRLLLLHLLTLQLVPQLPAFYIDTPSSYLPSQYLTRDALSTPEKSLLRTNHQDPLPEAVKRALWAGSQQFPILHQNIHQNPEDIESQRPILHQFLGKRNWNEFIQRVKGERGAERSVDLEQTTDSQTERVANSNEKRASHAAYFYPLLHMVSGGKRYPNFYSGRFPILHSVPTSSLHFIKRGLHPTNDIRKRTMAQLESMSADAAPDVNPAPYISDPALLTEKRVRRPKFPSSQQDDRSLARAVMAAAGSSQLYGSKTGGFNNKKLPRYH